MDGPMMDTIMMTFTMAALRAGHPDLGLSPGALFTGRAGGVGQGDTLSSKRS